ncbi:Malonyl CoA-acyl carrier protein transacylase [Fulvivirga imtechensis AK7]|uniref:Malonyl CoA-acyl carrier protein transacylase n=1 Tax=Fulvivirga imtechensis AK7 TaxID=1237149 RepID=L8JSX0_9BACT|nr:acyltransferase domain-containing protein [Fulvivirga imtechensis]ELR72071.1 Malonyl CoA-acyl carrier protein transacylase [Fulvivirga imtechensis AK7]
MKKQVIFMFSGQGSQYYQMGKELYEGHAQFRYWMDHCNEMVSPMIQASLLDILYKGKGKSEPFDNILYTNPALLSIEYSLSKVLNEVGIQPDLLMGYSLGEIVASVVGGSISLEDGLQLVVDIARLAEDGTPPASMLAIMASKTIMTEFSELFHNCWLAGANFPAHFVVSGPPNAIQHLQQGLNKENITSQILPVRHGFHTALIDPIEEMCKQKVRKINPSTSEIPIISSLGAGVIDELNADYLWNAIRNPVNFEHTIEGLLQTGDYIFIDVGPSGTLATFVKYILSSDSGSISFPVLSPFGRDLTAIERLKDSLFSNAC